MSLKGADETQKHVWSSFAVHRSSAEAEKVAGEEKARTAF